MFERYDMLPYTDQMLHAVHFLICCFSLMVACFPLLTFKGSEEHRFTGMIYVPVACAAFLLASFMAWREESLVLFCFNMFCAYLLLSGWRAIHEKEKPVLIDWLIPSCLFALAVFVTLHAMFIDEGKRSFYLMLFAFNAYYLVWRDWKHLRRRNYWQQHKIFLVDASIGHASDWLNRHMAGMIGSMIANLSVVVLTLLPLQLHWMWPFALVVTAGILALHQQLKKRRLRAVVVPLTKPKPAYGVVRSRYDDHDIKRAA